jgi:hypothetical protein
MSEREQRPSYRILHAVGVISPNGRFWGTPSPYAGIGTAFDAWRQPDIAAVVGQSHLPFKGEACRKSPVCSEISQLITDFTDCGLSDVMPASVEFVSWPAKAGHPRLYWVRLGKTWMTATSATMTPKEMHALALLHAVPASP